MESIKKIYRIGRGPSSSHTIAPKRAAEKFLAKNLHAHRFRVTLFESLAATGKGHLSDLVLKETFAPAPLDIVWKPEQRLPEHPNGMLFEAFDKTGNTFDSWKVYSVGGGALREEGAQISSRPVYALSKMNDIMDHCIKGEIALWQYVEQSEGTSIWDYLETVWQTMYAAIDRGLQAEGFLPGSLRLKRKASTFFRQAHELGPDFKQTAYLSAYAFAVAEDNAAGQIVVTAPTCGACGIVPAILRYMLEAYQLADKTILQALATAGLIGNLIKTNGSISGAEVGCQGEVGSACAIIKDLPRILRTVAASGRGIARQGAKVFKGVHHVGYITSGTMIPFWQFDGEGLLALPSETSQRRSIALAYLDSDIIEDEELTVNIRGKKVEAIVVPYHMRSESPPYVRPILFDHERAQRKMETGKKAAAALRLVEKTIDNTQWRQQECINLIPSEMSASSLVRMLSIMDPCCRYAEHKKIKAYYDAEVFYYQGTDYIDHVEALLVQELKEYFGCAEVEARLISGQLANTAVFSAMVDYINQADRKKEPRRIYKVMNNHIGKGGHLSAQPMGALRDFVSRDPITERPAVVNFPVLADNPFKIDIANTLKLIDEHRPELIIFGKSMVISKEPVKEVRHFLDDQGIGSVLMYDMAHVLGLVGPHFQEPFAEGADLVTGSTHKTFFGTQRGIVAGRYLENEERYALWEAIERRTFPGFVSNHHLGTMVGLLMAAYEMNHFKDQYQSKVISNAKSFARALKSCGLQVAGDPAVDYTETHQVLVEIGYAKGPAIARKLEENNIICNYQAGPEDESFAASGALRLGVAEMTRFGMEPEDFQELAQLMRDVIVDNQNVKQEIIRLRQRFLQMRYCFATAQFEDYLSRIARSLSYA